MPQATPSRPADAAEFTDPPQRWQARWIWTAQPTRDIHAFACFRQTFDLKDLRGLTRLYITASRQYICWLNGRILGRGPAISDPRFQRYDIYDPAEHLNNGTNTLAVLCYHDAGKAMSAHAEHAGLLCQLEVDGQVVAQTDENWKAQPHDGWKQPGDVQFSDSQWPEIYVADDAPTDWMQPSYDDLTWPRAAPRSPKVHRLWGAAIPQARFFPWANLIPSETRPLVPRIVYAAALHDCGEVLQQREVSFADTAVRMSLEEILPLKKARIDNPEAMLSADAQTVIHNSDRTEAESTFDGLRNATFVLDFAALYNARVDFTITAPRGTHIEIGYGYRLHNGRVIPYESRRTSQADNYVTREGKQHWQTFDWRHFRYLQLTFRELDEPLTVHDLHIETLEHPFEELGAFHCDDEQLNWGFDISRETVKLNVIDRTMDNPSRERRQYLGDCSGLLTALWPCFGDAAVIRRYFAQIAEAQHPTGMYRYAYPGHRDDGSSLFDHTLSFPLRLWEHYQHFGDAAFAAKFWPGIRSLLELIRSCLDDQARMTLPPFSVWFDWAHMQREGLFLPLQAMSGEVMRRGADMATLAGDDGEPWRSLSKAMIERIGDWYDPQQGLFVDSIIDGEPQQHASEHGNGLVLLFDMAHPEQVRAVMQTWHDEPEKLGQASPAWPYLPAVWIHAGRTDLALRWWHRRAEQLHQQNLETWPELWQLEGEKTLGRWRTRNSRAVAQGAGLGIPMACLIELCGIQPETPGYGRLRLRPQPGPLKQLHGTMPTADGQITMHMNRSEQGWFIDLQMTSEREVILETPFAPQIHRITVNGKDIQAERENAGTMPGVPQFRFNGAVSNTIRFD